MIDATVMPRPVAVAGIGGIRHRVHACALGHVLVAATARGVCMVAFDDRADVLVASLRSRFGAAAVDGAGAGDGPDAAGAATAAAQACFARWQEAVLALVASPQAAPDVPLDLRGTAFQHTVWQALCAMPSGSTASYRAIAGRIGRPGAARAVAGACARNPVALLVPCHRVVREDGGLGGYRWGIERKRMLLERECSPGGWPPRLEFNARR